MKKGRIRKTVSGLMAVVAIAGSLLSPMTAVASETPETEAKPPLLKEVKDLLDEKEIVKAYDLGIDLGSRFDVEMDFTHIEIPDNEWVKVSFEEAKNEAGEDFSTDRLDTYDAIYYVEPLKTDHPKYQVSRKLIIKEPGTEIHTDNMPETESADITDETSEVTEEVEPEYPEEPEAVYTTETEPPYVEETEVAVETNVAVTEIMTDNTEPDTIFSESEVETTEASVQEEYESPAETTAESIQTEAVQISPVELAETEQETEIVFPYELSESEFQEIVDTLAAVQEQETTGENEEEPPVGTEEQSVTETALTTEECSEASTNTPAVEEMLSETTEETVLMMEEPEKDTEQKQTEAEEEVEPAIAETEADTDGADEITAQQVKEFKARLKIVKMDADTGRMVLIPNAEFKVYDLDKQAYVEQITSYPDYYTHTSYFTDNQGFLIMPRSLRSGNYRIEEVTAPFGYALSDHFVQVKIDSESACYVDETTGDNVIEVCFENTSVKAKLSIAAQGEKASAFQDGTFVYEKTNLIGTEFEIIAAEDIYTSDYQKDDSGNRYVAYAKGIPVTSVTTDENGMAVVENLPLGTYEIREKNVPEGYVKTDISKTITFEYADQNTPVVEQNILFLCDRQKVEIVAIQQDAENDSAVEGAVLGLYNKTEIKNADGKLVLAADSLIEEAETGEDGKAIFQSDLPFGKYYVKELKTPAGYVSSDEILEYEAVYQDQDTECVRIEKSKKNAVTTLEFTAIDQESEAVLGGALLVLNDKEGNEITSWTSVKDQALIFKRLKAGESYILHEEQAPYGYLRMEDLEFTVENTAETQNVTAEHKVPTALLIINSKGEFLSSVKTNDDSTSFQYDIGSTITKVTFEVYAEEDIKAADGKSPDYYKAGERIAVIETDENGVAQLGDLPVGKYYVIEKATAQGYVLDEEPRSANLSYRDQDTPVVTYNEEWQNNRQRVTVSIVNKEKKSEKLLSGAVFGLFSGEDISSESGNALIEKNQLIERGSTDKDGTLVFTSDLPIGKKYYVKEMQAADGYVTTDHLYEFTFEAGSEQEKTVSYQFTVENEKTTVSLMLKLENSKKNISGASMKVTDESGDVFDKWTTDDKAHEIKGLTVGKTYTMIQVKPAAGYVSTANVKFKVENTADVQKFTMTGDVTKLSISKTDASRNGQVAGAKLIILDKNDKVVESWTSEAEVHYVEKLPVGSYMIREEQAAKGYVIRSDVKFELADSGKVQSVSMSNETAKGKVILNLTDEETGRPLMGAEFELRDASGNVISTLKTDAAGHAESKLVEIASYKKGTYGETLKYHLVQTKKLEGYLLDSTDHEIAFEYVDQNTPIIEVTLDIKNQVDTANPHIQGTETKVSENPKTGDTTNFLVPILMMLASLSVLAGIIVGKRKAVRSAK